MTVHRPSLDSERKRSSCRGNETAFLCFLWYFLGGDHSRLKFRERSLSCCLSSVLSSELLGCVPSTSFSSFRCPTPPPPCKHDGFDSQGCWDAEQDQRRSLLVACWRSLGCDERSHSRLPTRERETRIEELALIQFSMKTDIRMASLCRGRFLFTLCIFILSSLAAYCITLVGSVYKCIWVTFWISALLYDKLYLLLPTFGIHDCVLAWMCFIQHLINTKSSLQWQANLSLPWTLWYFVTSLSVWLLCTGSRVTSALSWGLAIHKASTD